MNREIKFRAWLKADKKMYSVKKINWTVRTTVLLESDFFLDAVELMQYTGLKDKNGKEIYEGDIVKILDRDWPSQLGSYPEMNLQRYLDFLSSYCEVIYSEDRFSLRQIKGKGYFNGDLAKGYGRDVCEVIGNIYENSNLLKQND